MPRFEIGEQDFLLDGEPYQIISGAMHYFRIHPELWADRIEKARLMGLNTIETYVAWNAHEPRRGEWDATGWNDLGRFLDLVAEAGMHAIVRPGPYICAEWHNGGLPLWLTAMGTKLRSSDPNYLAAVDGYLRNVYEIVEPRQIDRGGNVILVQIENEYGAYGSDQDYLRELIRITKDAGITVPLTTVDQPQPQMLEDGSLPELLRTGSFGSNPTERLRILREHQPTGPLTCMEFWNGWFDWWGSFHHTTSAEVAARDLDAMLAAGASMNFYLVHGGTNFGLTNGANHKGRYLPITTSYDYDAPIDEAGDPTEKYFVFREVIARYAPVPDGLPAEAIDRPRIEVRLVSTGDWLESSSTSDNYEQPPSFDELGQFSGLVRYSTELPADESGLLTFGEIRDYAWVEVDGVRVGRLSRTTQDVSAVIPAGRELVILVEEQGRVNYAERIGELKGLIGEVSLNGKPLTDWRAELVDLGVIAERIADAKATENQSGRVGLRGEFQLDAQSDLFLDTNGFGKGYAFINGFLLGRYWANGPQRTLYVPSPVTKAGANQLILLELEGATKQVAKFVARPMLGPTEE